MNTIQLVRYALGLSWIYHGLFPKLLGIAPLEMEMSSKFGFSEPTTILIIQFAGAAEIVFGIALIVFYRSVFLLSVNIAALFGLLGFVIAVTPHLLVEAFNPVTTNLSLAVLSMVLLDDARRAR